MRVVRSGHFWQFGSIASLATETTDGEILVAFLAQTWPQKRSQEYLILKIFLSRSNLPPEVKCPGGKLLRSKLSP